MNTSGSWTWACQLSRSVGLTQTASPTLVALMLNFTRQMAPLIFQDDNVLHLRMDRIVHS